MGDRLARLYYMHAEGRTPADLCSDVHRALGCGTGHADYRVVHVEERRMGTGQADGNQRLRCTASAFESQ